MSTVFEIEESDVVWDERIYAVDGGEFFGKGVRDAILICSRAGDARDSSLAGCNAAE